MNFFNRILRGNSAKSAEFNLSYKGAVDFVHLSGTPQAMMQSPTASAGIGWIVQNITEPELIAESMGPDGWDKDEASDILLPLTAPLRRSQERYSVIDQTYGQKLQGIAASLEYYGNAYLLRLPIGAGSDVLQWVPSSAVSPIAENGSWARIDGYDIQVFGESRRYAPEEVLHVRLGVDPDRPALGLSPLKAVGRALLQDAVAAQYMERTLKSGAPGIIVTPAKDGIQPPNETLKKFTESLRRMFTGEKYGGVVGIDGNFELDTLGYTPEQMALDIMACYPQTVICSSIGVPPQVIGVQAGQKTSTYSNIEEANKNAARNALVPIWIAIADAYNAQMLGTEESAVRCRFDWEAIQCLQENEDNRWKRAADAYSKGVISREEAQRQLGIQPHSDGWFASFDRMPRPLDTVPQA